MSIFNKEEKTARNAAEAAAKEAEKAEKAEKTDKAEKNAAGEKAEEKKTAEADQDKKEVKDETPEEKIAKLEKTVVELEEKRLRLIAEMENQRKRAVKDMETLRYSVMTDTLYPFFQVFDHFEMAVAASLKSDNIKALNEGMKMISGEFGKAFSDLGIEKIDAVGKDFDANTQEAVAQEASETVPEGKVIRQWCAGYKMGDHLLKAASVVVSSGKAKREEKEVQDAGEVKEEKKA